MKHQHEITANYFPLPTTSSIFLVF